MNLIITHSIQRIEFEVLQKTFSLEVIKAGAKKSLQGLGNDIKSSSKIPSTCLKKIHLTSTGGAGRVIFLLQIGIQKSVLVMIRMKNDKQIGSNMTVQNPKFKKALDKNLSLILKDLKYGDYKEYFL
ncbi:MAG: hypothetical protein WC882_00880 [Candidatus Gracilibacteria bacterium]